MTRIILGTALSVIGSGALLFGLVWITTMRQAMSADFSAYIVIGMSSVGFAMLTLPIGLLIISTSNH